MVLPALEWERCSCVALQLFFCQFSLSQAQLPCPVARLWNGRSGACVEPRTRMTNLAGHKRGGEGKQELVLSCKFIHVQSLSSRATFFLGRQLSSGILWLWSVVCATRHTESSPPRGRDCRFSPAH